ncbi:MAG: hypothetical protein HY290_23130 [Planctomycetia bacterium]|nr:hypothetical protein [Planctomycetia bacterium]
MNSVAVLKFCREVLSERQEHDKWQGWFWGIRCKVIDYWIARLESAGDDGEAYDLSANEQQAILASHPLLTSRSAAAVPAFDMTRPWKANLHERVRRYLEAVKSHR